MNLRKKPSENIVVKGENAGNQLTRNFLLFLQCFLSFLKTNLKFLLTSILSSANAFSLDQSKVLMFGKDLTLSQTSPSLRVRSTSLLKTLWEKEELLIPRNFSFSQCFLSLWRSFSHVYQIWNYRLQTLFSLEQSKICHLGKG